MAYVLIIFFQLLGISFHVMQKVVSLGDKFPSETVAEIFASFWKEDWDTLTISFLVMFTYVASYYVVVDFVGIKLPTDWYYLIAPFALALLLGYAGQRLIYKWFGTAEQFIDKKVTNTLPG